MTPVLVSCDDFATFGVEAFAGELFDDRDCVRALLDESGVQQVARDHAEQAVAELLVVEIQLLVGVFEQLRDRAVDRAEPGNDFVVSAEGNVHVGEPHFLVSPVAVRYR